MTPKSLLFSMAIGFLSCHAANSETYFNPENYSVSGNIFVFEDIPNVGWVIGEILPDDYFHLRKMVREHDIHTFVLDSPGGDLYESLYMAAVIHDRGIQTYIPAEGYCESACANLFFAGASRLSNGALGVHQFSTDGNQEDEEETQLTVSDVISFLNEFETPPVVYERMFVSPDMYYFSSSETNEINRYGSEDNLLVQADFYDAVFERVYEELYEALDESLGDPPSESMEVEPTTNDFGKALDGQTFAGVDEQSQEFEIFCGHDELLASGEGVSYLIGMQGVGFSFIVSSGEYRDYRISGVFSVDDHNSPTSQHFLTGVIGFRRDRSAIPEYVEVTGPVVFNDQWISYHLLFDSGCDLNISRQR